MTTIFVSTSHNTPATNYTIIDTSTNRGLSLSKQIQLLAFDQTVLFDSGAVDITDDTFIVPITANWITTLAIVQVTVSVTYVEFGGSPNGLQTTFALPTLANIKQ